MREPTVVVEVRVLVLPYRGANYRAGRRLLMPVVDARRLSAAEAVALLEDIPNDGPEETSP